MRLSAWRPTPPVALAVAGGLVGGAIVWQPLVGVGVLALAALPVAVAVGALTLTRAPWLLTALLAAVCVSAVAPPLVTAGALNLRLAMVAAPIALVGAVALAWRRIGWSAIFGWYLALLALYALFTLLNPATRTLGLSQVALLGFNGMAMAAAYWLTRATPDGVSRAIAALAWGAVVIAVWTGVVILGDWLGLPFFRDQFFVESVAALVDGELVVQTARRFGYALILGGFFAGLLALFAILLVGRGQPGKRLLALAAVAAAIGLVLSFGRGPLLATGVGFGVTLLLSARRRLLANARLVAVVAVVAVVSLALLQRLPGGEAVTNVFLGRASQLLDIGTTLQTGSFADRAQFWGGMLEDLGGNWLVGRGALAYRVLFPNRAVSETLPPASENIWIEFLHSAGLIGLLAFAGLHGHILWGLWRRYQDGATEVERWRALAMLGALVALLTAAATNPFAWAGLYWAVLGVWAAASERPAAR